MKIIKFRFEDKALNWRLEEMHLDTKLTLLVGASGVGKTQILKALMNLQKIAEGQSLNGIAWFIEFETLDKNHYIWEGEFETSSLIFSGYSRMFKIIYESLILNGKKIIDRTAKKIMFNGQKTPKLVQQESILYLLKEEDLVKPAYENLKKLYFNDHISLFYQMSNQTYDSIDKNLFNQYNTLTKIQESEFKTTVKLMLLSFLQDKFTFNLIKNRFISIFPTVEDIKVELGRWDFSISEGSFYQLDISIKEQGVDQWIYLPRMSWGMVRTLKQISELYLCAEGTVFLIDEFENSLGINCINEITQDILASERQLQFILTSHHPYIIDAISFANWKLVTRNASVIKTHNIDKFNIGKSRHSAFMQLIQLEEYQTGQEQL